MEFTKGNDQYIGLCHPKVPKLGIIQESSTGIHFSIVGNSGNILLQPVICKCAFFPERQRRIDIHVCLYVCTGYIGNLTLHSGSRYSCDYCYYEMLIADYGNFFNLASALSHARYLLLFF